MQLWILGIYALLLEEGQHILDHKFVFFLLLVFVDKLIENKC